VSLDFPYSATERYS